MEDFSVPAADASGKDASHTLADEIYKLPPITKANSENADVLFKGAGSAGGGAKEAEPFDFDKKIKDGKFIVDGDPGFWNPDKNIIIDDNGIGKKLDHLWRSREVTKEDRQEAMEKMHKQLEKEPLIDLLPEADRKAIHRLADSVLMSDTKAMAEVVAQYKGDPERLKAFCKHVEKELKELGARVNLDVAGDGSLLVYESRGNHAIQVGADGGTRLRAIATNWDGSVDILTDREPLRPSVAELGKQIANGAVRGIRDGGDFIMHKKEDLWFNMPHKQLPDYGQQPWFNKPLEKPGPYGPYKFYEKGNEAEVEKLKRLMDNTFNGQYGGDQGQRSK